MSAAQLFLDYMLKGSKYALILLSLAIIIRCIRSMLREQYEPETWAYIRTKAVSPSITGRTSSAAPAVRTCASTKRASAGRTRS